MVNPQAKRRRTPLRLLLLPYLALMAAVPLALGAGAPHSKGLDRSFSHDGQALPRLPDAIASSHFRMVVPQPDGKLLVIGGFDTHRFTPQVIERRLSDGQLDPSYGDDGELVLRAYVVGSDGAGRMLVSGARAGRADCPDQSLYRLDADGDGDLSFGVDGCSAPIPFSAFGTAPAPDERTYVIGRSPYGPYIALGKGATRAEETDVARLLPDGSLDPSFGNGGIVHTQTDVAVDSGGSGTTAGGITVAGRGGIIHLTAAGRLDASYGHEGVVTVGFEGVIESADDMLVLPDGGVVTAATCCDTRGGVKLTRLLPNGALDPSFGNGGVAMVDDGAYNAEAQLAEVPGGEVMIAASGFPLSCSKDCSYTPFLVRVRSDGSLDRDYGKGGVAGLEEPRCATETASYPGLAVDATGRTYLAAGSAAFGDACLFAFEPSGALETGFGQRGAVIEQRFEPSTSLAGGVAVERNGSIVVAAVSEAGVHDFRHILIGVRPTGALEKRLGSGSGFVAASVGESLVAGRNGHLFSLVRRHGATRVLDVNDRGKPIARYGSKAEAALPPGLNARFLLAQRDDRVLVFGDSHKHRGFAVFRLDPRGRPEQSFGRKGLSVTRFGRAVDVRSALVQPNGRIVLVGELGRSPVALRLLPNGALDRSFGRGGIVRHLLRGDGLATAVVKRGDKLVVACSYQGKYDPEGSVLVGLDADGRPDRSFGRHGAVRFAGKVVPFALLGTRRHVVLLTPREEYGEGLLARALRADGKPDRSFGSRGRAVVTAAPHTTLQLAAAAPGPRGTVVVAATLDLPYRRQVELLRLG